MDRASGFFLTIITMQLVTSTTPIIITRAIVTGMSNVVYMTMAQVYQSLSVSSSSEFDEELNALHIKTDVELIGALLSDMSDETSLKKSIRVCLDHLHTALQEINKSLLDFDSSVRAINASWFKSKHTTCPKILETIKSQKAILDHHFMRLVQLQHIV